MDMLIDSCLLKIVWSYVCNFTGSLNLVAMIDTYKFCPIDIQPVLWENKYDKIR